MPFLVDGNNLMHALHDVGVDVGRAGLAKRLAQLARTGQRVCVVYDGPSRPLPPEVKAAGLEIVFSGRGKADGIIIDRIKSDTAPRRLTVVSSDRQIRAAARRRRCRSVTSQDFAGELRRAIERAQPRRRTEPREKHKGLADDPRETQRWIREMGLEDAETDEPY